MASLKHDIGKGLAAGRLKKCGPDAIIARGRKRLGERSKSVSVLAPGRNQP
jgi:hypothetical protein